MLKVHSRLSYSYLAKLFSNARENLKSLLYYSQDFHAWYVYVGWQKGKRISLFTLLHMGIWYNYIVWLFLRNLLSLMFETTVNCCVYTNCFCAILFEIKNNISYVMLPCHKLKHTIKRNTSPFSTPSKYKYMAKGFSGYLIIF